MPKRFIYNAQTRSKGQNSQLRHANRILPCPQSLLLVNQLEFQRNNINFIESSKNLFLITLIVFCLEPCLPRLTSLIRLKNYIYVFYYNYKILKNLWLIDDLCSPAVSIKGACWRGPGFDSGYDEFKKRNSFRSR